MKQKGNLSRERRRAHAVERSGARRAQWLRLTRTIVLGAIAVVAAVVWLGEQYGIEREVIFEFLGTSALFVGLLAGAGLAGAGLLLGLRWLIRRRG